LKESYKGLSERSRLKMATEKKVPDTFFRTTQKSY